MGATRRSYRRGKLSEACKIGKRINLYANTDLGTHSGSRMPQDEAFIAGFSMEILTTEEMEHADRLAVASGTPGFALMLRAGQAVAEAAMDLAGHGPILVVAGRGNNGGGGF